MENCSFLFNRRFHIDWDFISLIQDSNDNALKLKSIFDDAFNIFEVCKKRHLKHIIHILFSSDSITKKDF